MFYDTRGNARVASRSSIVVVGAVTAWRGLGRSTKAAPGLANENDNIAATRERRLVGVVRPAAKPGIMPEQTAAAGQVPAQVTASASAQSGPVFHGLFRSTGSPSRSRRWSARSGAIPRRLRLLPRRRSPSRCPRRTPPVATSGPLDLFQEQLPDARALFRGRV